MAENWEITDNVEVCKVSSSYRAGIGYPYTALFYFTDRYFARVSYL